MNQPDFKPVEKGFGKRTFNRILKLLRSNWILCDGIAGWERTPGGVKPPPIPEPSSTLIKPWDLKSVSESPGTFTIFPGTILDGSDKVQEEVTLSDPSTEYTPQAGGKLAIRFTEANPSEYSIEYFASWPLESGRKVETEEGSDGTEIKNVYLPLWEFVETNEEGSLYLAEGVYGFKCYGDNHLQVFFAMVQLENYEHINAPFLIPAHRKVSL